eukprot:gb/GFBE01069263.1/.p1 GENE.gb/GFBE01069263.1/~~gb/GFBE01069263.1/.p1  ORF type:complete len:279 (+),score=68.93 gb/GFBE01069263.1/:1-837(+)
MAVLSRALALLSVSSAIAIVVKDGAQHSADADRWCAETQKQYGIKPGSSWGSLKDHAVMKAWNQNTCDKRIAAGAHAAPAAMLEQETNAAWCGKTEKQYGIKPGSNWGSLKAKEVMHEWKQRNCDKEVGAPAAAALVAKKVLTSWCSQTQKQYGIKPGVTWGTLTKKEVMHDWQVHGCDKELTGSSMIAVKKQEKKVETSAEWCGETQKKYGIKPGSSWGSLTANDHAVRKEWTNRRCDYVVGASAGKVASLIQSTRGSTQKQHKGSRVSIKPPTKKA